MKTVSKALSLLQKFVEHPGPKSLGTIAAEAGLDKSTARRMLISLCEYGMIEQNGTTREYSLGAGLLPLARAREAQLPLVSVVEPHIRDIVETVGETAHFGVYSQGAIAVVSVVESPRIIRAHVRQGTLLPLHSSGVGIAYLSACDDAILSRLADSSLEGTTRFSLTSFHEVSQAVARARDLGYAATEQTFEEGVCGIAAPVRRGDGVLAGAIGVVTPVQRMNPELRETIANCLLETSARLADVL